MIKLETKISETELNENIKKVLIENNINTITDLMKCKLLDLSKLKGIGKKSRLQIVLFTHKNGYFFKD
jgi:DNA-directed RNA polymerase alpha subunit